MNEIEMMRIIADDYDQAQRVRVGKGEQIRAIVQGREQQDASYLADLGFEEADDLLAAILTTGSAEPNDYLAGAYRRSFEMERAAFSKMGEVLELHPVWPWMGAIRGVGPTLGAKLLSRLDIEKAANASSFWCYCGLATVPGQRWECGKCGYVGIHPATHDVTGKHKGCKELAVRTPDPDGSIRAAQPRSERGQKRSYDAFAKKTLYILATSWLKAGPKSFYNRVYREKVAFYERERPGWEKGRRHFSALRVAEKLFLSHLYQAWCEAVGKEPGECYSAVHLEHDGISTPGEVLEWEKAMAQAAA
jgi:ribosomal protein S27AE